ncbi:MAG: uracil-DNA glycosylase [Rhodobacteraceae bacterium]|nr:uracil-DNA glycosylase [Paracoccaceae bacterium]
MSTQNVHASPENVGALMRWHLDAGVDETIGDAPVDRYKGPAVIAASSQNAAVAAPVARPTVPPRPVAAATPAVLSDSPVAMGAAEIAGACNSLADLRSAVEGFDGCALKTFASKTVFADGALDSPVMIIGEAPGEDEDRQGLPFVGVSGKLLDRMLDSVGLDRAKNAYITNIVFWRPPGNRKPTSEEVAICLPFVRRHIELLAPKLLILLGGPSATTMLGNAQGITKLRGKWFDYASPGLSNAIPTMATFHPAYLLRSPQQKRLAWRDLLAIRYKLADLGVTI